MTRKLSFDKIDRTRDTDDPVMRARFRDSGSWMTFIHDEDVGCVRVHHVNSAFRGDMRRMLDEITQQLDCYELRFMNPLDDLKSSDESKLIDRLRGFEHTTETFESPHGGEFDVEVYVGEWRPADRED